MRFSDMLRTAFMNLWRRKLRAFLTVLGMVIGVASIVVMVSLGLGIQEATIQSFAGTGSLTTITVNTYRQTEVPGNGGMMYASSTEDKSIKLNKKSVDDIKKIPGVTAVMPTISMWGGMLKSGQYVTDLSVLGLDMQVADQFGVKLQEGKLPTSTGGNTIELVLGNSTLQNFYNPSNYQSAIDREGNPKIKMNSRFQMTFDQTNIYGGDAHDTKGNMISHGKFYKVRPTGIVSDESNDFSWYILMDIDVLKKLAKDNKEYLYGIDTSKYTQIYVKCADIDSVKSVRTQITELGYGTSSVQDAVEMAQKSTERIRYLLGAIGGVALLVAAIGIMNTMMMSIYERTKEIGIIKVLGCPMGNIVGLFLTEAAYIGLFGGAMGLGVSYGISLLLNVLLKDSGMMSVIPLYLALGAVLFSIVVAMVSGLYPALRAMKLSPLNAIRNE
ncbi:MAG: ABC transporter permease [Clostridia bacterium]